MNKHLEQILWRLAGLFRTRVIVCMVGLAVMNNQPAIGQWVVAICGLALGVSAIDAWKGGGNGSNSGGSPQ